MDLPPCASDAFAPGGSLATAGPGSFAVRLTREAERTAETNRPPRFLGNPKVTRAGLLRPRRDRPPRPLRESRRGPHLRTRQGLPRLRPISGLNGPARAHAVYASPGGSPHQDARLASGCWPDSTGWAQAHWVPPKGFKLFPTSFLLSQACPARARVGPCAVIRRVDSSGFESRPVTGRSNR